MTGQNTERTNFEDVHLGGLFNHNNIPYQKVSDQYAELYDNSRANLVRNSYFDGPTVVTAEARHIRKRTKK